MQLRDKKILLTGATGGIGKALVHALLEQGAHLVLAGRHPQKLQQLISELPATTSRPLQVALDLGSGQAWEHARAIAQQHPDIDVLINCAGNNLFAPCDHTDPSQVTALLDINLKASILLTQALLPALLKRPQAMIVNIGSTFGSIGYPGFAVYCASKFGVRGYTEALRRELANSRVKVLYVAPRATATDMNAATVVKMNQALGNKMDSPEHVAACVVRAMASDRHRLLIGWPEKLFVIMNSLFTSVVDNALKRQLPVIQRFLAQEVKP